MTIKTSNLWRNSAPIFLFRCTQSWILRYSYHVDLIGLINLYARGSDVNEAARLRDAWSDCYMMSQLNRSADFGQSCWIIAFERATRNAVSIGHTVRNTSHLIDFIIDLSRTDVPYSLEFVFFLQTSSWPDHPASPFSVSATCHVPDS